MSSTVIKDSVSAEAAPKRGRKGAPWYRPAAGAWFVTIHGKQHRLCDGKSNQRLANRIAKDLLASRRVNKLAGDRLKVTELLALYLEYQRPRLAETTLRLAERTLVDFAEEFGTWEVRRFFDEPGSVKIWVENQPGWKSAASRKVRATLIGRVFSWAASSAANGGKRLISGNPLEGHTKGMATPDRRYAVYTPAQEADIMRLADPNIGAFFQFLILTGCRAWSEAAKLTAADLRRLPNGRMFFELENHKSRKRTGKPRIIRVPFRLHGMIEELVARNPTDTIFRLQKGGAIQVTDFSARIARWSKKLPWIIKGQHNAHACRHTFATRLLDAGVPIAEVAGYLNDLITTVEKFYWKPKDSSQGYEAIDTL